MLSVHKIMHFIHQKHHNMPFQTYYMTKNRLKTHYTKFNKQIWDFLPCAHLLCLYTALLHS